MSAPNLNPNLNQSSLLATQTNTPGVPPMLNRVHRTLSVSELSSSSSKASTVSTDSLIDEKSTIRKQFSFGALFLGLSLILLALFLPHLVTWLLILLLVVGVALAIVGAAGVSWF